MTTLYLIAIVALLPCLFCLKFSYDPLCENLDCPANQVCRHYKPCGKSGNCNVTAICTTKQPIRGVCRRGDPVLYDDNGAYESLTCDKESPCPDNAYCNIALGAGTVVCCLSNPDPETIIRPGFCPATIPDHTFCVDFCKTDGDCSENEKCCHTGCKKECVDSLQQPEENDPCFGKVCPAGKECRLFKPCGQYETCPIETICAAKTSPGRYGCVHGYSILHKDDGKLDMLSCWLESPCPSNAYCSTVLADAASRCCLTDPAQTVKSGVCPAIEAKPYDAFEKYFCYDECKHDGDCVLDYKCCDSGCKMECLQPEQ